MKILLLVCILLVGAIALVDRPIIGVLSLPSIKENTTSYFPASYVKWLESGGARVVPIKFDDTEENIRKIVSKVNGVFFTGGGNPICEWKKNSKNLKGSDALKLNAYGKAGKLIWDLVIEANSHGEHLPLWGTCLGFEMINIMAANDCNILDSDFDAWNWSMRLNTTDYAEHSRMIGGEDGKRARDIFSTQPVTINYHTKGVPVSKFNKWDLAKQFNVISTNYDANSKEFVSTMEHQKFPIYATQWHPEKVIYEFSPKQHTNHSPDSVYANGYPAKMFVNECRLNSRSFDTPEEEYEALIYNYQAIYTAHLKKFTAYEQSYFFNP